VKHCLWLAVFVVSARGFVAACPANQPRDQSALIALEQSWAQALEKRDATTIDCILAREFEDADIEGQSHSRTETLAKVPHRGNNTNHLSNLQPHAYGDFGYVRGLNTVIDPQGKVVAKVRFTDIFIYRDGRWQALAGQETLVKEDGAK
jgi:Domain of unknown function (DUF4440)